MTFRITLAALVLALTACGSDSGDLVIEDGVRADPTPTPTLGPGELPSSYVFTFSASCYCPDTDVVYRVEVMDDAVASAVVDSVGSRRTAKSVQPGDEAPEYYRISIQDMLDSEGMFEPGPADEVDVTWPEGSDHPTRIAVDRDEMAVDDEVTYEILSFRS
jgi:hypothetical protein